MPLPIPTAAAQSASRNDCILSQLRSDYSITALQSDAAARLIWGTDGAGFAYGFVSPAHFKAFHTTTLDRRDTNGQ
jgi:hypothetical protein